MAGRPFEKLPPGARDHLERMAENGLLSESAAATALGMPLHQFQRVIANHPASKKIWEVAMSIERDKLLDALYDKARSGDVKASQTLLAVRHGLSEKAPTGSGDRVQVTFNLPPAMDPADYMKAIEARQEALPSGGSD